MLEECLINLRSKSLKQSVIKLTAYVNRFGWCATSSRVLGAAHLSLGCFEDALEALNMAIVMNPNDSSVWSNLGLALFNLSLLPEAADALTKAKKLNPTDAVAFKNLGLVRKALGQSSEALDAFTEAIGLDGEYADAYSNRGCLLADLGDIDEALSSLEKAVGLNPKRPDYLYNLAKTCYRRRRLSFNDKWADRSFSLYQKALELNPLMVRAHRNLARVYWDRGLLGESTASYKVALDIDPSHQATRAFLLHNLAHMCEWDEFDKYFQSDLGTRSDPISPWLALAWEDKPEAQKDRSIRYCREQFSTVSMRDLNRTKRAKSERIRVGYFSSDFQPGHATMHLFKEVVQFSDLRRFEVHLFSYGSVDITSLRSLFPKQNLRIHMVAGHSSNEIVALADHCQLDIAVDLKGHTEGSRLELFAMRLAPIQISFLGYPGTTGSQCFDYIIADRVVLPSDQVKTSVVEKPLYLSCYQPNSRIEQAADDLSRRETYGLPEGKFIFCGFNAPYKIDREVFGCWMQILSAVPNGMLWLLETNRFMRANLLSEADRAGVGHERLIFATPEDRSKHLERLRHADLFLDTFNVNGHTTVSDALRVGLPVITKVGKQFAARVAASLLTNLRLSELITKTTADYIGTAVRLGSDQAQFSEVRRKLFRYRFGSSLYDSVGFTRELEASYERVQNELLAKLDEHA